jgi:hypothetical protein
MIRFLKRCARRLLDGVGVPLVQHVADRIPSTTVLRELERRTAGECADYVESRMPRALQFGDRRDLWDHAVRVSGRGGLFAEFGVWKGRSINHIAGRIRPSVIYGFDSFEGLQEDWAGWTEAKGAFDLKGKPPRVEPNVRLVTGRFEETLPGFLSGNPLAFSFVHIDCDTHEAAKTVLGLIGPRIQVGTVLVFDEYFGYRGWRIGEYAAWQDFVREHRVTYEYLAFSTQPVSLRVTSI